MAFFKNILNRFRHAAEPVDEEAEMTFTGETELNYDRDPFLHSLNHLTEEDIRLAHPAKELSRSEKMADMARRVMLGICVAVFVGSSVMLIDNLLQKERGAELYDQAAAEFAAAGLDFGFGGEDSAMQSTGALTRLRAVRTDASALSLTDRQNNTASAAPDPEEESPYKEQLEKLRATLRSYKNRNKDVYGYISIPAVGIEYVMVQGDDNDFYLDNNWLGEYLVIGSIFVDYRCEENVLSNYNTVIYGHNITTNGGAMFHGVEKFKDRSVFDSTQIYVYTMDGVYIYQPYSFYDTHAASGYIRTAFSDGEEFAVFAEEMGERSRHDAGIPIDAEDKFLTLSTCTNTSADGRYALHAVLVDSIT